MTLNPTILAALDFVDKMMERADAFHGVAPLWYGWALREAFLRFLKDVT